MPKPLLPFKIQDQHSTLMSEEIFGLPTCGDVFWSRLPQSETPLTPANKLRPGIILAILPAAQAISTMKELFGADALRNAGEDGVKRFMGKAAYFAIAAKCTTKGEAEGMKRTEREGRLHLAQKANYEPMGLDSPTMADFGELRMLPLFSLALYPDGFLKECGALSRHDMKRAFAALSGADQRTAARIRNSKIGIPLGGRTEIFLLNARLRLILDRGFDPREKPDEPWRERAPGSRSDASR